MIKGERKTDENIAYCTDNVSGLPNIESSVKHDILMTRKNAVETAKIAVESLILLSMAILTAIAVDRFQGNSRPVMYEG